MPKVLPFFKGSPKTRKEHLLKYGENGILNAYGNRYIYNPTPDQIRPGQMIRVWAGKSPLTKKEFGVVVKEVKPENGKVLVGVDVGGTLERWDWFPMSDVQVVWGNETFKEAMAGIEQLGRAVRALVLERGF